MRVLFVGNYRDPSGWGKAAIEYIQALYAAGVDVACRPIRLGEHEGEIPPLIADLERNDFRTYDAVIQNVLPHMLSYDGSYPQNVALYYTETSSLGRTRWADRINCMDMAWVACLQSKAASEGSGVTIPLHVVPIPCDVTKYAKTYEPLLIRKELTDQFIFYTVGEFQKRKNLRALLTAFHLEFSLNEPVTLLIKTTPAPGEDSWETRQGVVMFCDTIKEGLKLYDRVEDYKREVVLADRCSDHDMLRLHASCDCGVFTSYGEAWSIPAFDSMAMGKTPIVTNWGGFRQYMTLDVGWLVRGHMEPAYATHLDTFPDLHTAREEWASIDVNDLRWAMRYAYEDDHSRQDKSLAGIDRAHMFSYQKVGKLMKNILENR